jgi:hypothetical protein
LKINIIRNQKAVSNAVWAFAIVVLLIVSAFAFVEMFGMPNLTGGNANNNQWNPTPTKAPVAGMVNVDKPLKMNFANIYGGGALTGTTSAIQVYQQDGVTASGSALTIAASTTTSALSYSSGTHLVIAYHYSTTDYMFWSIIVPQMNQADAQSLTTNAIDLQGFNVPTLTDTLTHSNGTSISDGQQMNVTAAPTGSLTYAWFVSATNTGFLTSHDATYNTDNKAVVWCTVSGTGYTSVTLSGFDGKITRGTTDYYYKVIDPTSISMYKVGNNAVLPGTGSFNFGYTAIGYTGTGTTIQLYLDIYSDPSYMQNYGSYGPYSSTLAEQTVTAVV